MLVRNQNLLLGMGGVSLGEVVSGMENFAVSERIQHKFSWLASMFSLLEVVSGMWR